MTVQVTLVGNATADPELRFTPKGDAQAKFTLAVNDRIKQGDEWVNGEPVFYRITAWRKVAEQAAEHVRKGQRCVIVGKLKPSTYEGKDGATRTSLDVDATEVGLSVLWMDAPTRAAQPKPAAEPEAELAPF